MSTLATSIAGGTAASITQSLVLQSGDLLWLAVVFIVLAVVAGLAGFRGIAGLTMSAARLLVLVFIVLAIISFLL